MQNTSLLLGGVSRGKKWHRYRNVPLLPLKCNAIRRCRAGDRAVPKPPRQQLGATLPSARLARTALRCHLELGALILILHALLCCPFLNLFMLTLFLACLL